MRLDHKDGREVKIVGKVRRGSGRDCIGREDRGRNKEISERKTSKEKKALCD